MFKELFTDHCLSQKLPPGSSFLALLCNPMYVAHAFCGCCCCHPCTTDTSCPLCFGPPVWDSKTSVPGGTEEPKLLLPQLYSYRKSPNF